MNVTLVNRDVDDTVVMIGNVLRVQVMRISGIQT